MKNIALITNFNIYDKATAALDVGEELVRHGAQVLLASVNKDRIFRMHKNKKEYVYLSLDELPGPIVKDEDALIAEIKKTDGWQADEKYKAFVKRFNPYEDGNSSKRVLARVIKR
jgi:CDP-glycerol glycerophosphotransferase (TagB/SpsB family)